MVQAECAQTKLILVTGGSGFIVSVIILDMGLLTMRQGSHVVRRLQSEGYRVRITDVVDRPENEGVSDAVFIGNLCDESFCKIVTQNVDSVMHFAANMGGMGIINI